MCKCPSPEKRDGAGTACMLFGQARQVCYDLILGYAGCKVECGLCPQMLGQVGDQIIQSLYAQDGQHLGKVMLGVRNIAHSGVDAG